MSFEREQVTFYDSGENFTFRSAVTDLIRQVRVTALEKAATEGGEVDADDNDVIVDAEMTADKERREYLLVAEKDSAVVAIEAIQFRAGESLSDEAVQRLHDDIQESDMPADVRAGFYANFEKIRDAEVEPFMRRRFMVDSDLDQVTVRRDMGFCVNQLEVDMPLYMPPTELDVERVAVLEEDDLQEFIQALYVLGLVTHTQVKEFLEMF